MSLSAKGKTFSEKHRKHLVLSKLGTLNPMFGKHLTFETKEKISKSISGKKHWNWQGGKTALAQKIRNCPRYHEWRLAIYQRDYFTCVNCGTKTRHLRADHRKPFSLILEENKITTFDEALDCKELWLLENGRTLCVPCDRKVAWNFFRGG